MKKYYNNFITFNKIFMKKIHNNFWFTLVELIVVITILAILWTIAFISLQWYSAQARDSRRVSDIQNIKKSLELFSLNSWKYPEPDDYFTIKYWGQDLRYQWTVWEQVSTNLSRNLNEKPIDPLTESEYVYSRTYVWTEYEVLSIYESDLIVTSPQPFSTGEGARPLVVFSSYAANSNYSKINGNYNGVYVKAGTYYLPTPSIINALNVDLDLEATTNWLESQIITWWDNNIANAWNEASTWWLTWMSIEIFTWILDTKLGEDDYNNKEILAQALIEAYSWTALASAWIYKEIVETSSWDLVNLVDTFVLNNDNFTNTSIVEIDNTSCKTILDTWWDIWDWIYSIDPENNWTWFNVYCDMTTDWGGWTLVLTKANNTNSTSWLTEISNWWTDLTDSTANLDNALNITWSLLWNSVKYEMSDYNNVFEFWPLTSEVVDYWLTAITTSRDVMTHTPDCISNWWNSYSNCWWFSSLHYGRVWDPWSTRCRLYHDNPRIWSWWCATWSQNLKSRIWVR